MEPNSVDDWTILNKGFALRDAYYDLYPPWMRREYETQRKENEAESRSAKSYEGFEQFEKALKGLAEPAIASEMRDYLIAAVRRGAFKAYGVPEKPTPGQAYVEIPLTMLELRFIKWGRDRIENRHFAFRSVRVLRPPRPRLDRDVVTPGHPCQSFGSAEG